MEVNKHVLDIGQRTNTEEKLVICNFQFPKDINRPLFIHTNTCIIKHINHQNINLTLPETCLAWYQLESEPLSLSLSLMYRMIFQMRLSASARDYIICLCLFAA